MTRKILLLAIVAVLGALPALANDTVDPTTVPFADACTGITLENPEPSELCLQVMALRPTPDYRRIDADNATINKYSFYKVNENSNVFAAPGGAVTRNLGPGFNYVSAIDTSNPNWIQITGGEWMSTNDVNLVTPSDERGFVIDDNLANEYAYILGTVITSPFPGAPGAIETGVYKYYYNPVNIFATVELGGWRWYMIGPGQWVEQRNVAKVSLTERPADVSGHWLAVDLYEQTMVAYEDDTPVFSTIIASGLSGWDTNEGVFNVWYRVADGSMSGATGAPDAYALQSVPWTLYFDGDISLHGTYWHNAFGFRRSHGCVNLTLSDSRWLFNWTAAAEGPLNDEGELQTYVYVYSSGEY
ncbi:MAG: L,D-transpeptidase [Chloroflexota bacterium]